MPFVRQLGVALLKLGILAVVAFASLASAQAKGGTSATVVVLDATGRAVPFALVQLASGAMQVADDSGRAKLTIPRADSAKIRVRRIGFAPSDSMLPVSPDGLITAIIAPLPQNLGRVDIFARDNPLARRGFYDRLERVRRGAVSAWFMTPEEIELRNPARASHLIGGQQFVKIQWYNGRPVLTGRSGNCQMMVLLDAVRMTGMLEEAYTPDGQREIQRLGGGEQGYRLFMAARSSIDDVVNAASIQAVEVYATAATAPIELQRAAGPAPCGIIAIWTGSR